MSRRSPKKTRYALLPLCNDPVPLPDPHRKRLQPVIRTDPNHVLYLYSITTSSVKWTYYTRSLHVYQVVGEI
jgi:hypothetical protein